MEFYIRELKVVERTSKKGNTYKCIVAVDNNGNEHFICFTK